MLRDYTRKKRVRGERKVARAGNIFYKIIRILYIQINKNNIIKPFCRKLIQASYYFDL